MADRKQLAGPPGQSELATRLLALQSNRRVAEDAAPSAAGEPDTHSTMMAILPLLLAQGLDLATTEKFLHSAPLPGRNNVEGNPLPGMQSTAGRLGWGAIESALVAALLKTRPGVGMPVRNALVGTHTALARGNAKSADEQDEFARQMRLRGND